MKKMMLVSSFADVVSKFKEFINEDLERKTITFIPTASLPEKESFYVDAAHKELESLGLLIYSKFQLLQKTKSRQKNQ